jgi:uncharacterized protein YwqG
MAESFKELLLLGGVPPETAVKLATLPLPAVRLSSRRLARDAEASVAASKLGGMPDVGPAFNWPSWKHRPLTFLCQLNLADVAQYPFCASLPTVGVLAFFYDQEQESWGFDPKDRGSWLVHFEPNPDLLQRRENPGAAQSPTGYPACALTPSEVQTLPAIDSLAVASLGLSPEERDVYSQVLEQIEAKRPGGAEHQVLGHPSPIQGDMQLECQLVSHGLYCGDPSGYTDPRARALETGAGDWHLLLQVDTDDTSEMMWGDCGRLYFWITDDALRRRAFEECWMILQCS